MQKIRGTYKKYQLQVFSQNPRKVASDKAKQYTQLCDNQMLRMQNQNNFSNLDQVAFYKDKFQLLAKTAQSYQKKKTTQAKYQEETRRILKDDPPGSNNIQRRISGKEKQANNVLQSSKSKSPLKDFFDEQDVKMSKRKLNFSSVMNQNEAPLNFGLKSSVRPRPNLPDNSQLNLQLKKLQLQNRELRQRIRRQGSQVNGNSQKLNQLKQRIRDLDQQNRKLRQQSQKQPSSYQFYEEQYDPYSVKCRQNNINKINNRNIQFSDRKSKYSYERSNRSEFSQQNNRRVDYFSGSNRYSGSEIRGNQMRHKNYQYGNEMKSSYKDNILDSEILNSSHQTIQTQLLNLQNSELYDQAKNQICRQKIAFFKKSMILVKDKQFQIAFKRSDFNKNMDRLRLIIYVNNKSNHSKNCSITYDYQRSDYDITVKKNLRAVDPRSQSLEEIQIFLKNVYEYGSLINADISVGGKVKKIVVPALFIDFNTQYKYDLSDLATIQKKFSSPLTIRPMSQYSSVQKAGNIIDLLREYDQKYQTAKLYGRSKACNSIVKLSWKSKTKLQIQTCQPWKILLGYLFLNAEETEQH